MAKYKGVSLGIKEYRNQLYSLLFGYCFRLRCSLPGKRYAREYTE